MRHTDFQGIEYNLWESLLVVQKAHLYAQERDTLVLKERLLDKLMLAVRGESEVFQVETTACM